MAKKPNWVPDLASPEVENLMESQELSESDRDQIRGFAEFLRCIKEKHRIPEGMKKFALGEDFQ